MARGCDQFTRTPCRADTALVKGQCYRPCRSREGEGVGTAIRDTGAARALTAARPPGMPLTSSEGQPCTYPRLSHCPTLVRLTLEGCCPCRTPPLLQGQVPTVAAQAGEGQTPRAVSRPVSSTRG